MPLQSLSKIASANLNIMACLLRRKEFRTTEVPEGVIMLVYLLLITIQTNFTSIIESISSRLVEKVYLKCYCLVNIPLLSHIKIETT